MALDCEKAFEEEMKKIDSIGACLARIEKILTDNLKDKKDDKRSLTAKLNLNPYRLEFDEIITPNLAEFNFTAVNPNFKIADRFNFDAVITQNAVKFNPIIIKTAVSQNAK